MRSVVLPLVSILFGTAVLVIGNGLLGTVLAVRGTMAGFSAEVTGLVMATYFAGFMTGSVYCVRLVERVGHIRVFAALASIASAATLAHALVISAVAWSFLRFATGFCMAGLYMAIESWLNERATQEIRGRLFSIYMTVNLCGLAAGQMLLVTDDPREFELLAVSSILISLALVPIVLTRAQAPPPQPAVGIGLGALYAESPLGVVSCFGAGLAMGAFWGMGPVFALRAGFNEVGIAAFMICVILGGVVLQWPIGLLSDRFDRRRIIFAGCVASAVVAGATAVLTAGYPETGRLTLLLLSSLFGGLLFPLYALGVAHTNDRVTSDRFVAASSALLLVYGAGASAGPVLAGAVMGRIGPGGFFVFESAALILVGLFAVWRIQTAPPVPAEDRETIVMVPRTTPAAVDMDPRAAPEETC